MIFPDFGDGGHDCVFEFLRVFLRFPYLVQDFVNRRDCFKNELVIASHFSTRYTDRQIHQYVKKALPDMLDGRLHLWM